MILRRSHVLGFGRLSGLSVSFGEGLNIVFSPNEGGKSTLQRFLVGMLYGQLRSVLKVQRRPDPWVDQYKPWYGSDYGGILWLRLADGRELEVHRAFGREESRIEIRSVLGEDITRQYEHQRNGEVLFARSHLGLPKELFESVAVIKENRVAEIQSRETIRDRIANLAQSGDEELSINRSLAKIEEALESIGSERAPTKPYRQALDLVQALRDEQKALQERRAQFQGWIEERNRIAAQISELERELCAARADLLQARKLELTEKVRAMEEIENDIRALRAEIESLEARADFPADRLDELNRLVGARESLAKHLGEIGGQKEEALAGLARAQSERQKLAAYSVLAENPGEAEKITEWFVTYLSQSLQRDGIQKSLSRLHEEVSSLERELELLPSALRESETDWQRVAREAAEEEQIASYNSTVLIEKIALQRSSLSKLKRKQWNRKIAAVTALVLTAAALGARIFDATTISSKVELALAIAFAITAVILFFFALKCAKATRNAKQILNSLEAELASLRDQGAKKRKQLDRLVSDSGFARLDDFLEAAKKAEQDRRRLSDLKNRWAEAESQRRRLQVQIDEAYGHLKESLAKVGLSCSPGSLKSQIDVLRKNLRRFRELDANCNNWMQRSSALKQQEEELTAEYREKCSQIESLLAQAKVDTPEMFREECHKRDKLMELIEREASLTREFRRVAGDLTLSQWKDRLRELTEQADRQLDEKMRSALPQARGSETGEPYLPYFPSVEEAEQEEKRVASCLFKAREEYARVVERIDQAFQNFRTMSEIEEDLALAERNYREMEINRRALNTAFELIENLSRQQQEVLAPQLNAAVEQRFLRFCGHRYEEVKVDPDFQVWVRELNGMQLRPAEQLSRGTQDQLYFAMRFGILDLISNEDEPCPVLLDEPFAAYDRTRLREAFKVLEEEVVRRQLVLFTCREDLVDLATQHQANLICLPA